MFIMESVRTKFFSILENQDIVNIILESTTNTARLRSLLYNLRNFPHLKENLINGHINPEYFAKYMTHDEMLPVKQQTIILEREIVDGIMKCDNCDSMKTEYTEIHTLEYTLFHVYCKSCGHASKI